MRFEIISSVSVGSLAPTSLRIAIIPAMCLCAASCPGPCFAGRKISPSMPETAQERVPVPFLPQLPVRPRSSAMARSIRSPW